MSEPSNEKSEAQVAAEADKRSNVSAMLDEMIKGVGDGGKKLDFDDADNLPEFVVGEAKPQTETKDEPETDETQEEVDENEEDEEEVDEEPSEDEEVEEEVEEEPEKPVKPLKQQSSPVEEMRQTMVEMRQQMDQMLQSGRFVQAPTDTIAGEKEPKRELQILDFVKNDEEFEAAVSDREALNRLMNRVYYTGMQEAQRSVPLVVQAAIEQQFYIRSLSEDFFKKNSDLLQYRRFVGSVVNEVYAEDPSLDPAKVLDKAAERVRKELRLKRQENKNMRRDKNQRKPMRANFPGKQGSRPVGKSDTRTNLQQELDEL